MRKLIFTFFLCLLAAVQSARGYDFSYTYKGQTLYYDVLSTTNKTAGVAEQLSSISGAVEIPAATVTYGGVTYTVTSIGKSAFSGCSGLTSVTIPTSVTSIGGGVFYYCSGLTDINVSASNANYQSIDGILYNKTGDTLICCPGGKKGSVTIPNSVTSIGDDAFYGCIGLTSVTIPASVTSLGNWAFSGCSGLTSVTIPNSVKSIGDLAFSGCSGLTSVTIPNAVKSIGDLAFSGCSGLTDINVSASNANYQSIDGILYNKTGDTLICCPGGKKGSVTIPNAVKCIGDDAFYGCSGLTSVTIPDSVTSIGDSAFSGCSGLTSVTIGNSVTYIDYYAFYGCSDLTSLTVKAMTPPTCEGVPFSVHDTLYVPKESVDLYKSTSPWNKFETIIGVNFSDVPTIKADANLYVAGTELQNRNNEQVTVYNAMGKVVLRSDAAVVSLEALPHGVYVVATSRGNMKVVR